MEPTRWHERSAARFASESTGFCYSWQARDGEEFIPGRSFLFVLADEVNPLTQKVVRRVLVNPKMAEEVSRNIGKPAKIFPNPERYGFRPTASPDSPVSLGRHAMNVKPSPYLSASKLPMGSGRFTGSPFWIDVDKAKQAGATLHDTPEIIKDLDRIASKIKNPDGLSRIEFFKKLVRSDREVLLKGAVPPSAVKSLASMGVTRGLQGLQIIGFTITAVELKNATVASMSQHSIKPLGAEVVRQTGGWGGAFARARLGGTAGAAVGIETGPGALITMAGGAVVGGALGYFGFDWIADHISPN